MKTHFEELFAKLKNADVSDTQQAVIECAVALASPLYQAKTLKKEELLQISWQIQEVVDHLLPIDLGSQTSFLSDFLGSLGDPHLLLRLPIDFEQKCFLILEKAPDWIATQPWLHQYVPQILSDPWSIYYLMRNGHSGLASRCFAQFQAQMRDCYHRAIEGTPKDSYDFADYEQGMSVEIVLDNLIRYYRQKDPLLTLRLETYVRYLTEKEILETGASMNAPTQVPAFSPLSRPEAELRLHLFQAWKNLQPCFHLRLGLHSKSPLAEL